MSDPAATPAGVEMPIPNGIFADSGLPLSGFEPADIDALAEQEATPSEADRLSQVRGDDLAKAEQDGVDRAILGDLDPNDLSQAGWGVIFAADADATLKDALKPLLDRRREQAGEPLFKVFEGGDGYRPGDTAVNWLERHGVGLSVVDPYMGVPFYLLLVGSPQQIPFEFQYTLDIYWAVGRLHFDDPDGYRRYAESVVAYETAAEVPHARQAAIFATKHEFDKSTQLFASQVAEPLMNGGQSSAALGQKEGFALSAQIGEEATRDGLARLLRGELPGGPPALLLTGSHGMAFDHGDERLPDAQGALVCQEWDRYGAIERDHWFEARDVPEAAKVHGLIHFFFACYSAGCPSLDTFDRFGSSPKQIAPRDIVARLPQALLSHTGGGALATLGHVDRAWNFSFQSARATPQLQGFRDVMGRILRGERVGQATDQFNIRWAALSTDLSEALLGQSYAALSNLERAKLANRWIARDDARNYVIMGDPAVRLRVEDMPKSDALTTPETDPGTA